MSDNNGKVLPAQVITVITDPENPVARFQAVPSSLGESNATPLFSTANQGEMTSWLLRNGYQWVTDTYPQQWVKR
ncbi:MAG TPA: hypothetical protein IGS37_18740 [Synechococcales cyanobacterium M55_K2018_004]|nr:hypothetical protein [Synechococcales cyanobacterium M55_K2018_004]